MKILIQRVSQASVQVDQEVVGSIQQGFLCLVGIHQEDTLQDQEWMLKKLLGLRIFEDSHGKMNQSIMDVSGELLMVSQFTLMANCKKGTRPSFTQAMAPQAASDYFDSFLHQLRQACSLKIEQGIFGADMKVELLNDGPVTILLDSHE